MFPLQKAPSSINHCWTETWLAGRDEMERGGGWVCGERGPRLTEKRKKTERRKIGEGRRKKGCVLRVKGEAVYLLVRERGVSAYMHQLPMLHYLREKLNWCRSLEGWWNREPNLCWVTACRCQTHQRRSHFTMQLPAWCQRWNMSTPFKK